MSELATRAKLESAKICHDFYMFGRGATEISVDSLQAIMEPLIEQALLAERRLAYESMAEMIESAATIRPNHEVDGFNIAASLRAAAEKEVGTK